jgi:hypothetical protein
MYWTATIKNHPCVEDGRRKFNRLDDLERFVGEHDIQTDHIIDVTQYEYDKVKARFKCTGSVCISSVRLLLSRKD